MRLLVQFCNLGIIKRGQSFDTADPLWTRFEVSEQDFEELSNAFEKLFPEVYKILEDIRKGLPSKVDEYKRLSNK